jgi:acylphosphatase
MTTIAKRFLVSGDVQGVSFRDHTRKQAEQLGVRGHAWNLADGRVEVLAEGNAAALESLEEWLWTGPRYARVEDVSSDDWPVQNLNSFDIGSSQKPSHY